MCVQTELVILYWDAAKSQADFSSKCAKKEQLTVRNIYGEAAK